MNPIKSQNSHRILRNTEIFRIDKDIGAASSGVKLNTPAVDTASENIFP
jgi:hypothetical protein